ncbi:flagellar hook-length control protein FliK [Chitinivorax sp. B]|uniref:flagellar hook-length control protein FliK n=1 Tax=Chitinivorax sp. B TaxID=2502235 RepID=UPI0010F9F79D|nr:flagellar hook-length control protein FliK [Chitinivorax sp. B]
MIHNDALGQLNQLVRRVSPTLIEANQEKPPVSNDRSQQFVPGERIPAHVLAALPNGRFEVLVKNQLLDMNLPGNAQPGEALDLTFIRAEPRPTFALTKDMAALVGNGAGEVKFSETAKFLGALLSRGEQSPVAKQVVDASPIIDTSAPDTKAIAQTLNQAVTRSGFFYESHQAEWVTGQRSLQTLQDEPQAKLGSEQTVGKESTAAPSRAKVESALVAPRAEPADATRVTGPAREATLLLPDANTMTDKASSLNGAELAPQLRQIVQQQLGMLDTRQLMWHGMAWPNQPMDWSIEEQLAAQQGAMEAGEDRAWYSRMKLNLPSLGEVVIGISLRGQDVAVNFHVAKPDTADRIREARGELNHQLEAAGLRLAGSTVDLNDEADANG